MPMTNIEFEALTLLKSCAKKYLNRDNLDRTIDWEERRYQIAKSILAGYAVNHTLNLDVESAVKAADALIEVLKKKEND